MKPTITKPMVVLEHYTPLWVASQAIRQCWQSQEKSDTQIIKVDCTTDDIDHCNTNRKICGKNDKDLIARVANKFKHASTLEHISYNFTISGVSRALLQELARHRITSLSVKSSRYTLKELKTVKLKTDEDVYDWEEIPKFIVLTGTEAVDNYSALALLRLQDLIKSGISNDMAKYCMPEAFKTQLAWTINARSLQNFLSLRSSKAALWEIRNLAYAVYESIPEEHKYLFTDNMEEINDS